MIEIKLDNRSSIEKKVVHPKKLVTFLLEKNVFRNNRRCPKCKRKMSLVIGKTIETTKWVCRFKFCCGRDINIRYGSLFSDIKIDFRRIILTLYEIFKNTKKKEIIKEIEIDKATFKKIRDIVWRIINKKQVRKIGGMRYTVEVDESCLSKRKYNTGRLIKNVWVVGGICRETKEMFFELTCDRNKERLHNIILENVNTNTTIITDSWKGYCGLNDIGYNHLIINHKKNFVDPENRNIHTQNIENRWRYLKMFLKSKGNNIRGNLKNYISEYLMIHTNDLKFAPFLEYFKHE